MTTQTIEYLPDESQPDTRFELTNAEIEAYFENEVRALEKAASSSQHRQIASEYHDSIERLRARQTRLYEDIEQSDGKIRHVNFSQNSSDGYLVARVLEAHYGTVICSVCQNVYGAEALLFYDWSHGEFGGRLVTCVNDHILLETNERLGELVIPIPPFQRTLREQSKK